MVTTGVADFGPQGGLGIITTDDMAQLLLWALRNARSENEAGTQYRKLVRKLKPLISGEDRLMLAAECPNDESYWSSFAEELRRF